MKNKLNCILLIDDDEGSNLLNNMVIAESDCAQHIKIEKNGMAALNYIAKSARLLKKPNPLPFPDLIFLDIFMPEMDGWNFLLHYKSIEENNPQTPVIIMHTVSVTPEFQLKARTIPQIAEISNKPMTPEMVNSIVFKYFPDYI